MLEASEGGSQMDDYRTARTRRPTACPSASHLTPHTECERKIWDGGGRSGRKATSSTAGPEAPTWILDLVHFSQIPTLSGCF